MLFSCQWAILICHLCCFQFFVVIISFNEHFCIMYDNPPNSEIFLFQNRLFVFLFPFWHKILHNLEDITVVIQGNCDK